MEEKLNILLNQIKIDDLNKSSFNGGKIEQIKGNRSHDNYCFYIDLESPLSIDAYLEFKEKLPLGFPTVKNVSFKLNLKNYTVDNIKEYINLFMDEYTKENPLLSMFKDNKCEIDNDKIIFEVGNLAEKMKLSSLSSKLLEDLENIGFKDLDVMININAKINNSITEEIKESLKVEIKEEPKKETVKSDKPVYNRSSKKSDDPNVILGRLIDGKVSTINTIFSEEDNVTVDAYVFGVDYFESSKSDFRIITLKITDNTDSMYCKVFVRGDSEYSTLKKALGVGSWLKIRGYTKNDTFSKELVLNARDINKLDKKVEKIEDKAEVKRVELHAHTMMSQMDGLTKIDLGKHTCELVSRAIDMGYRGVAITDHNGCQAFPIAYGIINSYNKKQEDPSKKFKGLYGTELTLVDDTINIVVRPTDLPLEGTTFVVFDTETTGFNAAGGDQMIEIGAVKICDGNIIDRFDELIDPGCHIPDKITNLTYITDEMVKGKDNEETVTRKFLEWAGDLPMVAHNAKFDISFIEMAMKKYNLGEFKNTVVDRAIDQGYARHGLSALVKRYNVPWDEDAHHRADYDAEGTALVYDKMMKKLIAQNYEKISDLERLISKDEIHKFGRTYHFNAIAVNKKGLKNLFKIISLANTVYLYKTPRILRSKLEELREGLLIGSGCYESEVFIEARSKEGQELTNIINFYDYVEVQPPEVYNHLIQTSDFKDEFELENHIKKIVDAVKDAGKIMVATGDVHHFTREDKIYREIIVNQKVPGGGRHPLARNNITNIPSQHFRTTEEMLSDFSFLDKDLAYEIVVTNTNKILDMVEEIEVIIDTNGIPFSPRVKSDDGKSYLDCPRVVTDLVFEKAADWYGENLPYNIEERIAKELYGDIVYKCFSDRIKEANPSISDEEFNKEVFGKVHETIVSGFDKVKEVLSSYLKDKWTEEDGELTDEALNKKLKKELGGIIGGGFDPIYLIAQRLVKHSNDDGYLVGSRGSVGSSFVATMMGITEVNPLPAHYRCLNCKTSVFNDDNGNPLGATYSSGFDLPDKKCPNCGEAMYKDGQDMPFATFLGFNADKVPEID